MGEWDVEQMGRAHTPAPHIHLCEVGEGGVIGARQEGKRRKEMLQQLALAIHHHMLGCGRSAATVHEMRVHNVGRVCVLAHAGGST